MTSTKQRYMDIKPAPKTEYELWVQWRAYMSGKLRTAKKIEVK